MNIYILCRPYTAGYDEYDSAVVIAEDEDEARHTKIDDDWVDDWWIFYEDINNKSGSWVHPNRLIVELIGYAKEGMPKGAVVAAFNAG